MGFRDKKEQFSVKITKLVRSYPLVFINRGIDTVSVKRLRTLFMLIQQAGVISVLKERLFWTTRIYT